MNARAICSAAGAVLLMFFGGSTEIAAQSANSSVLRGEFSEGTWMSLDVAPDGQRLVFELLGDLYLLPIAGGRAVALTSGMAFDAQPRFSPSGEEVLFVSDRSGADNLWTVSISDRRFRQITQKLHTRFVSPTWAPDASAVWVSQASGRVRRSTPLKVWRYDLQTGVGSDITSAMGSPEHNHLGPQLDSTGRLWITVESGEYCGNDRLPPSTQIYTVDIQGGGGLEAETALPGGGMRPAVSPDARWLVYATREGAIREESATRYHVRNLATGAEHLVTDAAERDEQESCFSRDLMPGIAFLPDSSAFIAPMGGRLWRVAVDSGSRTEIPFVAPVAVEVQKLLRPAHRVADTAKFDVRFIQDPAVSPDGRSLAFSALQRVWVADADGRNPRRLTAEDSAAERYPTWSPDGKWIAYATWEDERGGAIRRHAVHGKAPSERLTQAEGYFSLPAYSPDGTRIYLLQASADLYRLELITRWQGYNGSGGLVPEIKKPHLVWISAVGGEAHRVATSRGIGRPHFVSGSSRVYLYEGEDGLVSYDETGANRRVHATVTGHHWPMRQAADPVQSAQILPTGDTLLVVDAGTVLMRRLNPTGGAAPIFNTRGDGARGWCRLDSPGADFIDGSARAVVASVGNTVFTATNATVQACSEGTVATSQHSLRLQAARDDSRGHVLIRNVTLPSLSGAPDATAVDILVAGSRVAAIGATGSISVPPGTFTLEGAGLYAMPGLIDAHDHPHVPDGLASQQPWSLLALLAYGVTTSFDPASPLGAFVYADLVETGRTLGPRMYMTGPPLEENLDVNSEQEAERIARRYADHYGVWTVKEYVSNSDRGPRQLLMDAMRARGLRITAEGPGDMRLALTYAIDGVTGHEHAYPLVPLYKDVLALVAHQGRAYTPTLMVLRGEGGPSSLHHFLQTQSVVADVKVRRFLPPQAFGPLAFRRGFWESPAELAFPRFAAGAAQVLAAGGLIAAGAHGEFPGLGSHWELWGLASGLGVREAWRAATISAAKSLGLERDLGSIERGKIADILLLSRHPLERAEHSTSLRYVLKGGIVYDADSLARIAPEPAAPPMPFWRRMSSK